MATRFRFLFLFLLGHLRFRRFRRFRHLPAGSVDPVGSVGSWLIHNDGEMILISSFELAASGPRFRNAESNRIIHSITK